MWHDAKYRHDWSYFKFLRHGFDKLIDLLTFGTVLVQVAPPHIVVFTPVAGETATVKLSKYASSGVNGTYYYVINSKINATSLTYSQVPPMRC